jgi:hypothetical protein
LAGAMFNRSLSRLGDFDGAGGDDLGISYALANGTTGSVVVVKGGSSFASRTLPDTTNAIQLNGTAAGGGFGVSVVGIGQFFSSAAGTTLVSTASIVGTSYAFGGQSPAGGTLTAAASDDSTVGVAAHRYGTPIGYLGPLGSSPGALTLAGVIGRYVDVNTGTSATGPFLGAPGSAPTPSVRLTDSQSGNSFGIINVGSGIRGTSRVVSFIGGDAVPVPDLVVAGQAESSGPSFYIINGNSLLTMSGVVDVSVPLPGTVPGIVKVTGKFPADWSSGYATGAAIIDLDGDGHGDFAIGESVSGKPGRTVVFY